MPTEPRALCPGDGRPGSGTMTWAWSLETVRVAPWTLLVAGGPPGLREARPGVWLAQTCPWRPFQRLEGWAGAPSQTPFTATRHSGPVLLPPEPRPPASLSPDGPHSVVQVVVGVCPALVPPPAPAQEKAHPAASIANARVQGPPQPALLVWACLPSRWDTPGQEALSMPTPVSPGPVRFVDQRTDCALKPSLCGPRSPALAHGLLPRFGSHGSDRGPNPVGSPVPPGGSRGGGWGVGGG